MSVNKIMLIGILLVLVSTFILNVRLTNENISLEIFAVIFIVIGLGVFLIGMYKAFKKMTDEYESADDNDDAK